MRRWYDVCYEGLMQAEKTGKPVEVVCRDITGHTEVAMAYPDDENVGDVLGRLKPADHPEGKSDETTEG